MRLLLDSHVPRAVAERLRRNGTDAVSLSQWATGQYGDARDDRILLEAWADRRVLVSYDRRTIPSLLLEWAMSERHHAGVILVDDKTFRSDDIGGLLRGLTALIEAEGDEPWEDRVVHLRPPKEADFA